MTNKILDYNIDYSLVEIATQEALNKYNMLPIRNDELSVLVASSFPVEELHYFVDIFQKPLKCLYVDEKYIKAELQYIELKQKLFILAQSSLQNIHKDSVNSYIINFIDLLFSFSIEKNASDIHFEALNNSVVIRIRIDGELQQLFRFDDKLFALISSIIKYFGNLDISQRRIPLNGRFTRNINKKDYDLRISTMPTVYGESIVLRILDNGNIQKDIENIGFDIDTLKTIQRNIHLNQGLILVTGPTGSGKTTSLYSMINSLNTKNKKIITIEDPVEYKLDGVMQVNLNNEINLDYQTVLKNILRQDPDILLIGEIRDTESLQIAIQASLTGHLVIATLHTNNAIETLTRLFDLQAQSYLVATTLKMILSQRLLRVLCSDCKIKDIDTNKYKSNGCQKCNYTGYNNRQIISEVLSIDSDLSKMIANNRNIYEIEEYCKQNGYVTLKENALKLVENGITTIEEFYSKV